MDAFPFAVPFAAGERARRREGRIVLAPARPREEEPVASSPEARDVEANADAELVGESGGGYAVARS